MQRLEIKLAFCFKFKKGDWFDKILTHRSTFQVFFLQNIKVEFVDVTFEPGLKSESTCKPNLIIF